MKKSIANYRNMKTKLHNKSLIQQLSSNMQVFIYYQILENT